MKPRAAMDASQRIAYVKAANQQRLQDQQQRQQRRSETAERMFSDSGTPASRRMFG